MLSPKEMKIPIQQLPRPPTQHNIGLRITSVMLSSALLLIPATYSETWPKSGRFPVGTSGRLPSEYRPDWLGIRSRMGKMSTTIFYGRYVLLS